MFIYNYKSWGCTVEMVNLWFKHICTVSYIHKKKEIFIWYMYWGLVGGFKANKFLETIPKGQNIKSYIFLILYKDDIFSESQQGTWNVFIILKLKLVFLRLSTRFCLQRKFIILARKNLYINFFFLSYWKIITFVVLPRKQNKISCFKK